MITLINQPHVYGYRKDLGKGLFAEIVRCYPSEWSGFISDRKGNVKANPLMKTEFRNFQRALSWLKKIEI